MDVTNVKGASLKTEFFKPAEPKVDSKVTTKINKFLSVTNEIDDVLSRNRITRITYNVAFFGTNVKGTSLNKEFLKPAYQPAEPKVDSKVTTKINKFLSLTNGIDDVLSRNPIMRAGITYNGELFGTTCHISSMISGIIPIKKK
jgi:hypothetical protein